MKQGKQYTKIIMLVLVLMVASYILFHVASNSAGTVSTAQAVVYSTSESLSVSGLVVRQEQTIPARYDLVLPTRSEGEKVTVGTQVAVSLLDENARSRQAEIRRLEEKEDQLRLALSYQTQLSDESSVQQRILQTISAVSRMTQRGSLAAAAEQGQSLKSLILRQTAGGGSADALRLQLTQTQQDLETLRQEANADTASIIAPQSGYYSAQADGYERLIDPDRLMNMTADSFQALMDKEVETPEGMAGRLITDPAWCFAAVVEQKDVKDVAVGDRLTVAFGGEQRRQISMTVQAINESEDGRALLVLRTDRYLWEVSALRKQTADLVFRSYTGLRIPKQALCYSDEAGSAGVYVLEGARAAWKNVELLYDTGEGYIAALDKSSTDNLWPGDAILLDTAGLYDGKVVVN